MQHITNLNFVSVFIKKFLSQYSYEELKKNHCLPPTGYLWNACEKGFVNSLVGSMAKEFFDKIEKIMQFAFNMILMGGVMQKLLNYLIR